MTVCSDNLLIRLKAERLNLFLATVGFLPLLGMFFAWSWKRPEYQFFPLALMGVGMLAWRAATGMAPTVAPGSVWLTRCLAGAAVSLWLLANFLWSPWLGYIAFLLAMVTVLWALGGKSLLKTFVPAVLMLVTILPPPLGWDQTLTLWLRSVAVNVCSSLLDWLSVIHVKDGNTLQLPGRSLLVEEACSGINSFVLCNALCVFWILWQRRSLVWLVPGFLATSLFVILGNVIRITAGAVGFYYWQVNLLSGWQHETFGLVLLLGYCVLILSLDQLLLFLTQPVTDAVPVAPSALPPPASPSGLAPSSVSAPSFGPPIFGFKFAGVFLMVIGLGVFAAHMFLGGRHGLAALPRSSPEFKLSLPDSLAGWQRVNDNSGDLSMAEKLGVHSTGWRLQREGCSAMVSVDYPLDGFHNVSMCYVNNGWQSQPDEEMFDPQSHADLHAIKLTLSQSLRHAIVWHSVMDAQGNWLSAPKAISSRFTDTTAPPTGYRIQLITGGYAPISAADEAAAQQLFLQVRQLLAQQLVAQLQKTAAP